MAASFTSAALRLRTVFMVLGCIAPASLIYTVIIDGHPFRKEIYIPWVKAVLVDFYINILLIWAWIVYKEANWIRAMIWLVLLVGFGSITICGYIVMQFIKLSPQESLQDPIYFVLLNNKIKNGTGSKIKLSVEGARVVFSALGFLMLGTFIYTITTDESPIRLELGPRWLLALLVEFYIFIFVLSVWVVYKEPNWIIAACWIILFIIFGGVPTCAYIVLQLSHLSSQDPVSLILSSSSSRANLKERKCL